MFVPVCVRLFIQITSAIPITQKQDIITTSSISTDTPSPAEPAPQSLPFPPQLIRSSSPKLDPTELYLKSKAMQDSKREFCLNARVRQMICLHHYIYNQFPCSFSRQH